MLSIFCKFIVNLAVVDLFLFMVAWAGGLLEDAQHILIAGSSYLTAIAIIGGGALFWVTSLALRRVGL